ncbi:WxcM-like domain-containing protein [Sphingobacterium litopenaei]|uniref:WxcM-like domain-containing protein n=1 Tax=Sphingobacterium litopenaei TaxID=2763500 RepID=A0ABR7YEM9_9SPHI|nr:WxcM-like domain-containing protein [Sphingobacterium litopenaei]MBD1429758.1 WxcM-like domain-containing protein [Sphingobacterium litopenaei]
MSSKKEITPYDIIKGGSATDHRGQIRFVNDFDMSNVKRFYIIKNAHTELVRGWRAHRIEQRWFYVLKGSFELNIIKIDNWESPRRDIPIERIIIKSDKLEVIHLPQGYATAFKALVPKSELLVFADYDVQHAKEDDYTWPIDYFVNYFTDNN